jgi:DNA-binding transcriptional LysR family regulator
VGLRMHTGELPGSPTLMSRRLLHFERAIYASPEYIEEMGVPVTPEDLTKHRIAAHSIVDVRGVQWDHNGKPLGKRKTLPTPRWLVNDLTTLERFALSGAGLALLSTIEEEGWVARGELVRVLPEYGQQAATASLIWPASRHLAPRVRAFIDHAVETMGDSKP